MTKATRKYLNTVMGLRNSCQCLLSDINDNLRKGLMNYEFTDEEANDLSSIVDGFNKFFDSFYDFRKSAVERKNLGKNSVKHQC